MSKGMSTVYCPYCFRHQILSVCFHDLKPSHPISFHTYYILQSLPFIHHTVELKHASICCQQFSLTFEICSDDNEFNDIDSGSDSLSSEKYIQKSHSSPARSYYQEQLAPAPSAYYYPTVSPPTVPPQVIVDPSPTPCELINLSVVAPRGPFRTFLNFPCNNTRIMCK